MVTSETTCFSSTIPPATTKECLDTMDNGTRGWGDDVLASTSFLTDNETFVLHAVYFCRGERSRGEDRGCDSHEKRACLGGKRIALERPLVGTSSPVGN